MDGFEQASAAADSQQNDCESAPDVSPIGNAGEAFEARAEQWRTIALQHADDRQACIGAITSGLAGIVHSAQAMLMRRIEDANKSLAEAPVLHGAFAAHTGMLRVLHSLLSFEVRLEQIRQDAEKGEAERRADPLRKGPR